MKGNKDKTYDFDDALKGHVHLEVQRKEFNSADGNPLHKPYVHICDNKAYLQFLQFPFGLSIVKVLHLPTGSKTPEAWAKAQAAKKKPSAKTEE